MKCDEPLIEAGAALLGERTKKAAKHVEEAGQGKPEAIRDLRVGVRKIRAALSILTETVLDKKPLRRHQRQLKALFRALGDARDEDVLIERLGAIIQRRGLTGGSVDALAKQVHASRKKARKRLRRRLEAHPPSRLFERIDRTVVDPDATLESKGYAQRRLVRHFLAGVLLDRYERVLAFELAVPGPPPALHKLRIAIKKLRYAIDFFAEPLGAAASALDEPLKRAQDQLGELHDLQVAIQLVDGFEKDRGAKPALAEVRAAEDEEAAKLLAAFGSTWAQLAAPAFHRQMLEAVAGALAPAALPAERRALRRAPVGSG